MLHAVLKKRKSAWPWHGPCGTGNICQERRGTSCRTGGGAEGVTGGGSGSHPGSIYRFGRGARSSCGVTCPRGGKPAARERYWEQVAVLRGGRKGDTFVTRVEAHQKPGSEEGVWNTRADVLARQAALLTREGRVNQSGNHSTKAGDDPREVGPTSPTGWG